MFEPDKNPITPDPPLQFLAGRAQVPAMITLYCVIYTTRTRTDTFILHEGA